MNMDPFNYRAGYTAVEAGKSMDKDMHSGKQDMYSTDTTGTAQTGRAQHKQDRHSTGRAGTMTFAITPLFHLCFLYTCAKMNNFINVVNNLLQCCAAPCQQLLSTSIVHVQQSLLPTINKLFSSTIVSSCSNNIVTTIVLCQH